MAKISRFEDFKIWIEAMDIAVEVYHFSLNYSDFSLKRQVNSAALSISNNIAEGFEYNNSKEFRRFLKYAKGSCGELRNMLHFLKRVELIVIDKYEELHQRVLALSKQIKSLMEYLKNKEGNNKK